MTLTTSQPGADEADAKRQRSVALDLVRALSILWVVGLWHVTDYVPEWPDLKNDVTYRVTVALLGLFVLVSGYLMGLKDVAGNRSAIGRFYTGRFGRIYPPFLAACLLFAIMRLAPVDQLARAATLIAMLAGPPPVTLWFITMIVLFYAVTPALLAARRISGLFLPLAVVVTALLAAGHYVLPSVSPKLAMYFPAYCAGLWLAGRPQHWGRVAGVATLAAPVGLLISLTVPTRAVESAVESMPWALSSSVALIGAAMAADRWLPRWQGILLVAQASYFLYLFHRPVYAVVLKLIQPDDPVERAACLIGLALPLAVVLGWIGQRAYDRLWDKAMVSGIRDRSGQ